MTDDIMNLYFLSVYSIVIVCLSNTVIDNHAILYKFQLFGKHSIPTTLNKIIPINNVLQELQVQQQ